MGFIRNIRRSIDDRSPMSVNSITLLSSALVGFMLGVTMCFVLVYDVITNGYVKTDLIDAAVFILASGGYIAGSGLPKTIIDSRLGNRSWVVADKMGEKEEDDENDEEDNEKEST